MSWQPCPDPIPGNARACDLIDTIVVPRTRDLGGFEVGRVLPAPRQAMVGPFIFFDHLGPAEFALHAGMDIRPHPHINLATVTYLFDGEITHRDSLGTEQVIQPGAVNWMSAGRGIVHSERSSGAFRSRANSRMFGLQTWLAMPAEHEEDAPYFSHTDKDELPVVNDHGVTVRLIAGTAWGEQSPVATLTDTLYADIALKPGARLPIDAGHEERGLYIVSGHIAIDGRSFGPEQLLVLHPDQPVPLHNPGPMPARLVLIGGATMDGPRYIWWNFVSSRRERIEQAKAEWQSARFDTVPGDAEEFIALPPDLPGAPRKVATRNC